MPCIRPKIIHYAAVKDYTNEWAYQKYEEMDITMNPVQDGESNA